MHLQRRRKHLNLGRHDTSRALSKNKKGMSPFLAKPWGGTCPPDPTSMCILLYLAVFIRFSKNRKLVENILQHLTDFRIITNESLKSLKYQINHTKNQINRRIITIDH